MKLLTQRRRRAKKSSQNVKVIEFPFLNDVHTHCIGIYQVRFASCEVESYKWYSYIERGIDQEINLLTETGEGDFNAS